MSIKPIKKNGKKKINRNSTNNSSPKTCIHSGFPEAYPVLIFSKPEIRREVKRLLFEKG